MANTDGGAAFPTGAWNGMSLRDYFAAQVMQELISKTTINNNVGDSALRGYADQAYRIADAMLRAR